MSRSDFSFPKSLQELPPKSAHFCLQVERQLFSFLDESSLCGSRILVGCSGGGDSVALLLVLHYLSVRLDINIGVAHVDHQLREESAVDADFVEEFSAYLGLRFYKESVDVKEVAAKGSKGIEEAARDVRYDFFHKMRKQYGFDWICIAHHKGDLSEDVMMRLLRGTGWPALGGMAPVDSERKLCRPFLHVSKKEALAFLEELTVQWCEDHTNALPCCLRNRMRLHILPQMYDENPAFDESVVRLSKQALLERDFWQGEVLKVAAQGEPLNDGVLLKRPVLESIHQALRQRVYLYMLGTLGTGQALADSIEKLDQLFVQKRTGKAVQFSGDKVVQIKKQGLFFTMQFRG
ncbi:MAG: tRNA lysidine(34) synthetase TilS [Desulfovibrio sp.]